jgi:chemotaxis protein methyltransferase CheR
MIQREPKKDLRMSDGEFRLFAELLRHHCGLHFGPETRFLLEKRIDRRMEQRSLTNYAAYHYELRNASQQDGELAQLIDDVTTNETYFFRERGQLRALMGEILPEVVRERRERSKSPISIWSAGCASGEEPYTIVILAREAGLEPGTDFRVYASDISRRMLRKARQGTYRESSFRETDMAHRERYFEEKDGQWKISDEIKRHVDFIHINLMDRSKIALLGSMDVILCRNVIIYFDMDSKKKIIQTFEEKLRPGGHLLLGHSESLINLSTSLQLRHLKNDLVYRRPMAGLSPMDPWHVAAEEAIEKAESSS